MFAKAGLGLIGLSAISVGGVAVTKPHLLGMDYMPSWHSLSEDNGFDTSTDGTKLGKKYGRYLVGATHKKSSNPQKTNQSWWEWAYRRWSKEHPKEGKFKNANVTKGYASDTEQDKEKALNQICKDAYSKTDNDFQTGGDTIDHAKFNKDEVWKFCSEGETQPQTISEFNSGSNQETYGENNIASAESEKGKLLSINSPNNKWVWDLKDKDFQSATGLEGYFQTERNKQEKRHIKDICKGAYEKQETTQAGKDKLTKGEVTKHCSLEGK